MTNKFSRLTALMAFNLAVLFFTSFQIQATVGDRFVIDNIRNALSYKGIEQFDYLVKTQPDELIDAEALAHSFLSAFDKLGLLYENTFEINQYEDEPSEDDLELSF